MKRLLLIAMLLVAPRAATAAPRKHPVPPAKKIPASKPAGTPAPAKDEKDNKPEAKQKAGEKVFDFNGLDISGRLRTPQLLYFLERATEELERASLEHRSFVPEMARSVNEAPL